MTTTMKHPAQVDVAELSPMCIARRPARLETTTRCLYK